MVQHGPRRTGTDAQGRMRTEACKAQRSVGLRRGRRRARACAGARGLGAQNAGMARRLGARVRARGAVDTRGVGLAGPHGFAACVPLVDLFGWAEHGQQLSAVGGSCQRMVSFLPWWQHVKDPWARLDRGGTCWLVPAWFPSSWGLSTAWLGG